MKSGKLVLGLLAGVAAGAVLGILFAPNEGSKTRRKILGKGEKYSEELKKEVEELVRTIPLQNKTSLTHYVARRKLVLDLFDKIGESAMNFLQRQAMDFLDHINHLFEKFQPKNCNLLLSNLPVLFDILV